MSKAIIRIDIPTDYADEYKQWMIEGKLCYLEDDAWTFLKEVEYKVEPYKEAISIEWINENAGKYFSGLEVLHLYKMIEEWEKENGSD